MKNWKTSNKTRKAYEDLYNSINPEIETSDTYLESIIKKVFVSDKEQTQKNAIWCQAILEIIFDEKCLSSKIETNTIDQWYTKLLKVPIIINYCMLFINFIIFINCITFIVER
jgi:hypothetical protein